MKKILVLLFAFTTQLLFAQTNTYLSIINRADSIAKAKDYQSAIKAYTTAFGKYPAQVRTNDRYNAACIWALTNHTDSAFANLNKIVGKTYFDYDHLTTDNDLTALRSDERWKHLTDQITGCKPVLISADRLYKDFDLMKSALQEAHTGLYWYNTRPQFDSICNAQRAKIRPGLTDLDFYNIIAPIVAFTKEGHTYLRPGARLQAYLRFSARYFPFYLKFINGKAYIINDVDGIKTKGMQLAEINGQGIDQIMQKFMSYEPSDGFNITSKYRWIEENGKFSVYYARCYPPVTSFSIEVTDPATNKHITYDHIGPVNYDQFRQGYKSAVSTIPTATYTLPAIAVIDSSSSIATVTFNSFDRKRYKLAGLEFHAFVKNTFEQIDKEHIRHLIIDIRNNGGGSEGYEDYLLSFMIEHDYLKYKYVQASAFHYSFYANSDYKDDWQDLDKMLVTEHYLEKDGRILRKPGIEEHEKPQPHPFKGDIYILTSGLTYSGGAEFASLAKNYTNAVFIGEEVGGGYYGNTSGNRIVLKLPASGLEIGIPILKFVVNTPNDSIPFGHGVLPDYTVGTTIAQYLNGVDAEMDFTKQLISKKQGR